jgi:Uma2 family endonuclease
MASLPPKIGSSAPEYAWEVATLYPQQGYWTESEYLSLTDSTNQRIELVDGRLEFLSMPTDIHEELLEFLFEALKAFVNARSLGKVRFAGIRVRTRPGKMREPDVLFLRKENFHLRHNRAWDGIDLAMEIVSDDPKDRKRDYVDKLAEYAEAGIPEYWIVDYQERTVIVNKLVDEKYAEHGRFVAGDQAASVLLDGFAIDVKALFEAADELK